MTLQHLKTALATEVRKLRTAAGVALIAALPWADEIKSFAANNMPALQPYLPENVYKFMGATVVITPMVLGLVKSYLAVKAANDNG